MNYKLKKILLPGKLGELMGRRKKINAVSLIF